jgi:N-acetylmuramoyl-L-alanine amidase CwlA
MKMYEVIQQFSGKNRTYRAMNPIGGIIHETAGNNDTDQGNAAYFNNNDLGTVLAHAFCDYDSIRQTAPWNEKCNHCAAAPNNTHIGVEMCHVNTDKAKFQETWERATWLFAHLFTQVITPCITIVTKENLRSHHEVTIQYNVKGGHTDPTSYFSQYGRTVDMFRAEVQTKINEMLTYYKDIQTKLNKCGFNLVVDGVFGTMSTNALKDFQTKSKLISTGKIDAVTLDALNKATVVVQTVPVTPEIKKSEVTLVVNDKNIVDVKNIDGLVYGAVREIGDALGLVTTWDANTKTVSVNKAIENAELTLLINGKQISKVKNIDGKVYGAAREIGDALGLTTTWDAKTSTAIIK